MDIEERSFVAFAGDQLIASGTVENVVRSVKEITDRNEAQQHHESVLVFEEQTGAQVDFDLRGTVEDVLARIPQHPLFASGPESVEEARPRGPGRPKLGVVCREVCLLPQQWEWLAQQPGGASVFLRRLVQEASRREPEKQRARKLREAANAIMTSLTGHLPNHEEASRALWAGHADRFEELVRSWPGDVRQYLVRVVRQAADAEKTGVAQ